MGKYTKIVSIALIIGLAVFVLGNVLFHKFQYENANALLTDLMVYELYALVLGGSNMVFHDFLSQWKSGSYLKRISVGLFGTVMITIIGLFLCHQIYH